MSNITIDDVKKVAALSGFTLTSEELEAFTAQFEEIINYIERLNKVDTTGVEPTYQVIELENITREDAVIDYGVSKEELLKNAPATEDGQLKVGRVL
ncbi:MAG TPA: Asp-tRNA(Asn)/Glu-tRNA(Gln) amidotransferase subunit GatC [Candidatus Saccharimonadales bacterium]